MKRYWQAFAYPFRRGNGGILLLGVAVLTLLPTLYAILPVSIGFWNLGLGILFLGYYAIYLRSILHSSMEGEEQVPPWPDWEHPYDILGEILSIVAPFLVSFLPLLVLILTADASAPWTGVASALLFLLGWIYLPMAILVWTFYGAWSILNPVAVLRSAWQTGPGYLLLSLLMALLVGAAASLLLLPSGGLTTFGCSLLVFYALVVCMRLLGTHYSLHRERLGWEPVRTSDLR